MNWQFESLQWDIKEIIKKTRWMSFLLLSMMILIKFPHAGSATELNEPCYEETYRLMQVVAEKDKLQDDIEILRGLLSGIGNQENPTRAVIITAQGPVSMEKVEYQLLFESMFPNISLLNQGDRDVGGTFALLILTMMKQQNQRAETYLREAQLRLNGYNATIAQLRPGVLDCLKREYGEGSGGNTINNDRVNRSCISFAVVSNAGIPGFNDEVHRNISLNACQQICLDREWCKSVDYHRENRICYVQPVDMHEVKLKRNYPGNPYDHYSCQ